MSRLLLGLLLLLFAAAPAAAQITLPEREFPSPQDYFLIDPSLQNNTVDYYGEFVFDQGPGFYLRAFPSWITGPVALRQPFFQARFPREFNLTGGVQSGRNLDPFFNQVPFSGATLEGDLLRSRMTLAVGTTVPPSFTQAGGSLAQNELVALGVTRRLGYNGFSRLTVSHWSPTGPPLGLRNLRPGVDHTLATLEVDPQLLGNWRYSGALGYDFTSPDPLRRDRTAYRWRVDGQIGQLTLQGSQLAIGTGYGPTQTSGNLQGTNTLRLLADYPITDNLDWSESFLSVSREVPGVLRLPSFRTQSLLSSLRWQANERLSVDLTRQDTNSSGSAGQPGLAQVGHGVNVAYALSDDLGANLSWRAFSSGGAAPSSTETWQGGLNWHIDPSQNLNLTVMQDRFSSPGQDVTSRQVAAGYNALLGDLGYFNLSTGWVQPGLLAPGAGSNQYFANVSGVYRPGFRWQLIGNYTRTFNDASLFPESYRLSAAYLVDEHHEVALTYNRGALLGLPQGGALGAPTYTVFAEIRQSFGGPYEYQFRQRHLAQLDIDVRYVPGGVEGAPFLPLEGAPVILSGDLQTQTDAAGQAQFSGLEPGPRTLALDTARLGSNYEPLGPVSEEIQVQPGARMREEFRVRAWSSIEAVVWNDFENTERLPVGYQPYEGIPVRVRGGGEPVFSDELGYARLKRLPPGRYEVDLDPERMPRAVATTSTLPIVVELKPGENKVVPLGVQAIARLVGRVSLIPAMGTTPGPLPDRITIRNRKLRLGQSEPDGTLDLRIPAGNLELDLTPQEILPDLYIVNPEELKFKAEPDETVNREIVLAPYATLTAVVQKGGRPLAQSGIAVEVEGLRFVYTNESGTATFRRLRSGTYTVQVDPASLPAGMKLASPRKATLRLLPGEEARFVVELQ